MKHVCPSKKHGEGHDPRIKAIPLLDTKDEGKPSMNFLRMSARQDITSMYKVCKSARDRENKSEPIAS